MNSRNTAIFAVLAAAFFATCNYVVIRFMRTTLSPLFLASSRVFIASVVIGITFRQKISFRRLTGLSLNKLTLLFVVGVLGTGVSTYLSTYALTTTQLANVSFIEACLPLVVYFYSLVLLGERFNFLRLTLALVSVYGVLVIATQNLVPKLTHFSFGETLILTSTLILGLAFICRKLLAQTLNTFEISFASFCLADITLIALTFGNGEKFPIDSLTFIVVVLTLISGIFLSLSVLLVNYAISHLKPALASQLLLSKVIFSLLFGIVFFSEFPSYQGIIGGILVVGSAFFSSRCYV